MDDVDIEQHDPSSPVAVGGSEPPPPQTRTGAMVTTAGVAVIALVTVGLTVIIGNARRVEPSPLDFAAAGSIRSFRMVATTTGVGPNGETFEMTMEGAFDFERELMSMTIGTESPPLTFDIVATSTHLFLKAPQQFLGGTQSDRPWLRMPLTAEVLEAFRQGGGAMGLPDDPRSFFDQLSSVATEVTEDGAETIRGIETTRYRLTLDVEGFMETLPNVTEEAAREALKELGADTMPATIWIGEDGLPYRQSFELAFEGTVEVVIDFFDYNERVQVELPPDHEVADAPPGLFGGREASCTVSQTGRAIGDGSESQPQPSPSVSCSPSP